MERRTTGEYEQAVTIRLANGVVINVKVSA
jgi:hypothetical protein